MAVERKENEEWQRLRRLVKYSTEFNPNWASAIELLKTRFQNRYFNPIGLIIEKETNIGEGFSIVSLQCSLIETFSSFRNGKIHKFSSDEYFRGRFLNRAEKIRLKSAFVYSETSEIFKEFLSKQAIFEGIFYEIHDNNRIEIKSAFINDFYQDVRCSLLHDCMTKNNWTINTIPAKKSKMVKFIEKKSGKKYIYRTLLQNALEDYFTSYLKELQNDFELRKAFARRLDYTYEITPDNAVWWQ